jgi:porphobilinogen synthase
MPGVQRLSIEQAVEKAKRAKAAGVRAVALFPVVAEEDKDDTGSAAQRPDGLACQAARALRTALPSLGIIGDIALDPYTSHGHDGILEHGQVHNDRTVDALARMAIVHARAGFDTLAPSDMMDGRIGAIRSALDADGLRQTSILAYAVKYASALYGPFRAALGSARRVPVDKGTYQMDPGNVREALREARLDIAEGADLLMVKPGLPYLDIIRMLRDHTDAPVLAYQVSGEYGMLRAGADARLWAFEDALTEALRAFKRAGAEGIFCYAAIEAAEHLAKRT